MSNSKWAALGVALLASTSLSTSASAAEWTAKMTGGAELGIAYVDGQDETSTDGFYEFDSDTGEPVFVSSTVSDNENIGLVNDSSIQFTFELVADNGLTFGYKFDFDTGSSGTEDDEYYGYVKGSFGRVELGVQDGAADQLNITPPGCSMSCPGDGDGYLFDHFSNVSAVSIASLADTSDDLKITYITPNFAGFTAGASYVSDTGQASQTDLTKEDISAWELGARWRGDITEDFDAGISFVYVDGEDNSGYDDESMQLSAEVGIFDSASIGGAYIWQDGDNEALTLGAEYGMGPWGFFVNWAQNMEGDDGDDGDWGISGEVDYDLAPGVTVGAIIEYASPDESDADNEFAIGTFMDLSF